MWDDEFDDISDDEAEQLIQRIREQLWDVRVGDLERMWSLPTKEGA